LITSTGRLLEESFNGYVSVSNLSEVIQADHSTKIFWYDRNVPNLLAFSPGTELTRTNAYARGEIILQDKASCFPGYLLLGEAQPTSEAIDRSTMGDIFDACAAPGNKTTHLAAIAKFPQEKSARSGNTLKHKSKIFACERDPSRSKVLQTMVDKSGATDVKVLARQDFLALDPSDARFGNVTHLLLDPSCSGSGIVGREDIPVLALPKDAPRADQKSQARNHRDGKGKKRKREEAASAEALQSSSQNGEVEEIDHQMTDKARLARLSNVQSRIVEHAFAFPAAVRVTYSTCSVHVDENESVVSRVLQSSVAKSRGWKLLSRQDQPKGLREWTRRGIQDSKQKERGVKRMADDELDACIRCYPGDDEGTMGFFVCCFVRSPLEFGGTERQASLPHEADDEEEWDGLSD
jgi:25S rRNA (cytosine2278-C5)-methyltransferase